MPHEIAAARQLSSARSRSFEALARAIVLALMLFGCGRDPSVTALTEPPTVSLGADASGETELRNPRTPDSAQNARYRGLWVLCEGSQRVLDDPRKIKLLMQDARALEVTDLFVQVYRGGRAWYRADQADDAPYQAIVGAGAHDPLALLIRKAHDSGLRVHAWVNVLSLSHNHAAPILQDLGRAAIQVDRRGRSILDYPKSLELPESDAGWYKVGTPGLYLDPAAPGVADRLVATFRELVTRYPELDGLHLDYIRHPGVLPFVPGSRFGVGLDYGYGAESRLRFRRETGMRGPYANDQVPDASQIVNADRWDDWRREKVTELVAKIGTATSEVVPDIRLSAAVISYVDRAYLSLAQDWRRWLEDGLLDFAVPMVYSKDDRLFRYQVESYAQGPSAGRIWAGVGVWLFENDPERARNQVSIVGAAAIAGDALFSYDSIVSARDAAAITPTQSDAPALRAPNLFSVLSRTENKAQRVPLPAHSEIAN